MKTDKSSMSDHFQQWKYCIPDVDNLATLAGDMEFAEDGLEPAIEPSDSSKLACASFGLIKSLSTALLVAVSGIAALVFLFPAFAMLPMTRRRVGNRPIAPIREGRREPSRHREAA